MLSPQSIRPDIPSAYTTLLLDTFMAFSLLLPGLLLNVTLIITAFSNHYLNGIDLPILLILHHLNFLHFSS